MLTPGKLVSIIIPIFNEETGIGHLSEQLNGLKALLSPEYELEFVFVDDGSRDGTVEALKKRFSGKSMRVRIVEHIVNLGVGAAFRTGFQEARGDLVCTIDADCTYSPAGLKTLLSALDTTGADIAVASPYHPDGGVEGVPAWRLVLSKGCSGLYRLFSPLKLYTYTSIFRAYRAEVVRNVQFKGNGFVAASEILISAGRQGYKVTEVPMILRARTIGRSKMRVFRTVASHLEVLFGFIVPSRKAPVAVTAGRLPGKFAGRGISPRDSKDPFAA